MTDLHPPLVPPDCDLRDFAFMPLDIRRLFTSETWLLGTADEKVAALALWCESWHHVPAASLPDNERMLAHLSQAGARWPKVREHVLRSWIKCSDGRLYHPVVAEKALESWEKKKFQRKRSKAANDARWGKTKEADTSRDHQGSFLEDGCYRGETSGEDKQNHPNGTAHSILQGVPKAIPEASQNESRIDPKGQGQGQGEGEKEEKHLVGSPPAKRPPTPNRAPDYPPEFSLLWREFVPHPNASKKEAFAAWLKLPAEDRDKCLDGAMAYGRFLEKERQRRPDYPALHLATFINQRRFDSLLEVRQ